MRISQRSLVVLAASVGLVQPAIAQEPRYALFELPPLIPGPSWSGVGGISLAGDVVGGALINEWDFHATLWPSDGGVVDLGTLGGDSSGAAAINSLGEIAGWAAFEPNTSIYVRHACVWTASGMIDLGTLGGESSAAFGMNDTGVVVGESEYEWSSYRLKAFVWENGRMDVLAAPFPGSDGRAAYDVNNAGDIVGYGGGLDGQYNALLWRAGEVIDLGSLDGHGSAAKAINELGVITGRSETADSRHAVIWIDGQIIDIHSLGPEWFSDARDISNLGTVVGFAAGPPGFVGFVCEPGQPMEILDQLVPPRTRIPWRIEDAPCINDAGQIGAVAYEIGNHRDTWALLLSPVYPTMTLQGPQPGRAGATNGLRVTGATPGARVAFLYSRHGGGTRIPGCDLQQNALQLDQPTVIGSVIADANGVASITRNVPLVARGQTILFQAVVQNECEISQLEVHTFE